MTTSFRAQQKERRAKMRARVAATRAKIDADTDAMMQQPMFVEARKRQQQKRQRRLLLVLLLLLLLLLMRCDCDDAPVVGPAEDVVEEVVVVEKPTLTKKKKRGPLKGTVDESDRGNMVVDPLPPPSWLNQFRLQVAARSPRLAVCFNGSKKPGALRWSALVHARSGRVTESTVEPVFRGISIDDKQHDCLVKGLTEIPFQLDEPDEQAAARRVSLIFEF